MPPPLVSARWRTAALVAVLVAGAGTAWLCVITHDATSTGFDDWALRTLVVNVGPGAARLLRALSQPRLSLAIILLVAFGAALARRWPLLLLSAVGPGLAFVITEYVLKPAVDRYVRLPGVPEDTLRQMFAIFPSGHETGVASAGVLVLVACGQLRLPAVLRAAIPLAVASWLTLVAAGLVRNFYHYATDTMGAVGVSVAVVLGAALAIDGADSVLGGRAAERREPAVEAS